MISSSSLVGVYVFADLHINSTLGLCAPQVSLDDGGTYQASKRQRVLYEYYLDALDIVRRAPGTKIGVFNGDIVEGDTKNRSYQVITRNPANILSIAIDLLEPLVSLFDRVYWVRGTAAHTGKSSTLEESLAADWDNTVPGDSCSSHYHLRRVISGVYFDICHHGKMSTQYRLKANWGNAKAADTPQDYANLGMRPPDILVRSHVHRYSSSGDNFRVRAVTTPCFQLATEFIYRIAGENSSPDIGFIYWTIKEAQTWEQTVVLYPDVQSTWEEM